MLFRLWRLIAWLPKVLMGLIWLAGVANAQMRDRPGLDQARGGYLRAVFFINAQTGWAVGSSGTILATHDEGLTWQTQNSETTEDLHGLDFADAMNGWAVGDGGLILSTHDGGQTWQKQPSGAKSNLRAVHGLYRARGRVAWAVGLGGSILKTIDGGASWQEQKSGTDRDLWAADFVDENRGWAVGDSGTIIATSDGGKSWQAQKSGTARDLYGINFGTGSAGWAVGSNGTIVTTGDGGDIWQEQSSGASKTFWSVYFVDATTGWAVGADGLIERTLDGGKSWLTQRGPTDRALLGIYFVSDRTGWAVGENKMILATRDGGQSWQNSRVPTPTLPSTGATNSAVPFATYGLIVVALGSIAASIGAAYAILLWRRDKGRLERELETYRFRVERQVTGDIEKPPELTEGALPSDSIPPPVVIPDVPTGLIDAINRGECTLFWGGGLSAQAGYPTWREALARMIEETKTEVSYKAGLQSALKAGRFSLVVDSLATRLSRTDIISQLSDLWGSQRPVPSVINALSRFPFANVVTSVWDPLIEHIFARRQPVVVMGVSSESLERLLAREAFCIVRLWGALAHPESVLFTPNEYRTAVAGNPTFAKYVASLTLSQSHFFIGASLDTIEEYLSAAPRGTSSYRHYALVPESEGVELAREVFRERGVELLVFRPSPGWPELPSFVAKLAKAVEASAPTVPPGNIETILLKKIELENVGPFKSLSLDLDPNWNVLLGNNGVGKSTVLRAIALVVCGDDSRALVEGARLLRPDSREGFVQLTVGSNIYRTELVRDSTGVVHVNVGTRVAPLKAGRWVILAFPPLRGVSGADPKGPTNEGSSFPVIQDVLPILVGQADSRLSNLKQWLVNLDVRSRPGDGVSAADANENVKLRDHFFRVFNAFVPGTNVQFSGVDRKTWQVNITSNGAKIGIEQLSQGTNSILGWVGAMLQRIYEIHGYNEDDSKLQSAVVLIDEIDAHLHPDWQQRIVGALSKQFPAVQFIATSHSPLIVGELEQRQVYRMRRQPGGEVVATYPAHPLKGLGVAGLLTSDLFDLESTVDKETLAMLEEQRVLSAKDKLTDTDKIKLDDLSRQLDALGFRQQMRDPEYTRYLQEKERLTSQQAGSSPVKGIAKGEVPPSVKELIREAVARATNSEA